MRVLVTGGAGFLGRHFVKAHLTAGDTVWIVDDLSNTESAPYFEKLRDLGALSLDPMGVVDFIRGGDPWFDRVYHFAAPVGGRIKIEGDPFYNAESLEIDSVVFRWAASEHGCKEIVYPSSSAVYGVELQQEMDEADDQRPLDEESFSPDKWAWYAPDEMYGFTKLAGEYLAWKAERYGVHTLCIRPFSGYGEGQSFDYPIPSIAARVLRREDPLIVWGSGKQTRDFIHVDDIVRLTRARLAQGLTGYDALNLGSGIPTSFLEIAVTLAEIVGYDPLIVTDPSKPEGVYSRYSDTYRQLLVSEEPLISLREGLTRVLADVDQRLLVTTGGTSGSRN